MKVQKRPRSSIRARRTACFSVSSSSRYMSFTSCRALSSWGCRSPFPGGGWEERLRWGCRPDPLHPWLRPVVVCLPVGLGTALEARGPGRVVGMPGLVEGLVPRAGKEERQAHRKKTLKLQSHPGLWWAELWAAPGLPLEQLCSGEPRGGLHKG